MDSNESTNGSNNGGNENGMDIDVGMNMDVDSSPAIVISNNSSVKPCSVSSSSNTSNCHLNPSLTPSLPLTLSQQQATSSNSVGTGTSTGAVPTANDVGPTSVPTISPVNYNSTNNNTKNMNSTKGPRIASSGGIRHNVLYNSQPPKAKIANTNSPGVSSNSNVAVSFKQQQSSPTPMNVVSDTCSISTHHTQHSTGSYSSSSSHGSSSNNTYCGNPSLSSGATSISTVSGANIQNLASTASTTCTTSTNNSHAHHPKKSPRLSSNPMPNRHSNGSHTSIPSLTSMTTAASTTPSNTSNTDSTNMRIEIHQKSITATNMQQRPSSSSTLTKSSSSSNINVNSSTLNSGTTLSTTSTTTSSITIERRQKRLERNRESARLSRRRRKQYLEILEDRVNFLSNELDLSRRDHVLNSTKVITKLRNDLLLLQDQQDQQQGQGQVPKQEQQQLQHNLIKNISLLTNQLNRTSDELKLCITFGKEYGKSLIVPPTLKFVLWLTLQNDVYYRGGRAASERLSAARIGERVSCRQVFWINFLSLKVIFIRSSLSINLFYYFLLFLVANYKRC